MTLNEAHNLPRCLVALQGFDEIIVIDSGSTDSTVEVAKNFGARIENFQWNGAYPKKRQWVLDNINIKNNFIFFVDADEEVTPDLIKEIKNLDFKAAGYFVKGQYIWNGQPLKYGLKNNKLVLFNRHKIKFPIVEDLTIEGMGEIEGHYQPILKKAYKNERLNHLKFPLHHFAYENGQAWEDRHVRYAHWEAQMIKRKAYPKEPHQGRDILKNIFRYFPWRGCIAFGYSYFFKLGFLDGKVGYDFAKSRTAYYRMVANALKSSR